MVIIDNMIDCTGCSTCYNVCPKGCIKMSPDKDGFLYPEIDEQMCVNCGLCQKTCPINIIEKRERADFPRAFLCRAKNSHSCIDGASGGLFTAIARNFIEVYNGVVYGAAYDNKFKVIHKRIDHADYINELSKSKYVQSEIGDCYKQCKHDLLLKKKVLFSGTACQIYGLKSYLGKEFENLYCVDVICHGVPSPYVYSSYLSWMKERYGIIDKVIFRDKKVYSSFYRGGMGILFKSGYKYFRYSEVDEFGQFFLGHYSIRNSCHECKYKTLWRISDLTVGDCWFSENFINEKDVVGYTLAFQQSEKGSELLKLSDETIYYREIDSENAIKSNGGMLYSSSKKNPNRDSFFEDLREFGFDFCVSKYTRKVSVVHKIMVLIKNIGLIPHFIIKRKKTRIFNERLHREIPSEAKRLTFINK